MDAVRGPGTRGGVTLGRGDTRTGTIAEYDNTVSSAQRRGETQTVMCCACSLARRRACCGRSPPRNISISVQAAGYTSKGWMHSLSGSARTARCKACIAPSASSPAASCTSCGTCRGERADRPHRAGDSDPAHCFAAHAVSSALRAAQVAFQLVGC